MIGDWVRQNVCGSSLSLSLSLLQSLSLLSLYLLYANQIRMIPVYNDSYSPSFFFIHSFFFGANMFPTPSLPQPITRSLVI